jgi:hypothetical protein
MVIVAAVLWSGGAAAQEPATQPSAEMARLIGDLDSDHFGTRQAAQNKLVEMGPAVSGQLQEAMKGNISDEARARLAAAVKRIADNVLMGPSRITMHYRDVPLQKVLDDFSRQSGADLGVHAARVRDYAKARTLAKLDLDGADFWKALAVIEGVSGLQPQPYNNTGGLTLDVAPGIFPDFDLFQENACTSGPVRIFAQTCQLNRIVQYGRGGGRRQGSCTLMLVAVPEPKLRILGAINGDWLRQCVDEHGQSLVAEGAQQPFSYNGRQWWWQLQANLLDVPIMGHRIASLRGELRFRVATKMQTTLTPLANVKNSRQEIGGLSVTVNECKEDSGQFVVVLSVSGPPLATGNPWEKVTEVSNSISILDERDQAYQQLGGGSTSQVGTDATQVTLRFIPSQMMNGQGIGPAAKMRWDIAMETRDMTVPFELHDLDLPGTP